MSTNNLITNAIGRAKKAGPALQAYSDEMRNNEKELEKLKALEIAEYEEMIKKLKKEHNETIEQLDEALCQVRGILSAFDPARAKVAEGFRVISKTVD